MVYLEGIIEPNEVVRQVRGHLSRPRTLPATYDIVYDPSSRALSIQIAQQIEKTVKTLGLAEYVKVTRTLEEIDSQRQYLGRWEAVHRGEAFRLTITQDGKCRLTTGQDTREGNWKTSNDGQLGISVGDTNETIWGKIDAEGHLLLDEGSISFERTD